MRANSAVDLLLRALPGAPVLNVQSAAVLIGRSEQAANGAVNRLLDARILKQAKLGRRNRVLEAPPVIDAFDDLARQLAGPEGDTHQSPPSRSVPERRG